MPRPGYTLRPIARATLCLSLLAPLAGCGAAPGGFCLLAGQHRALSVTLFFGRAIPGRVSLSDSEWADFVAREIAPRFPDGFTVFDATGAWRDPGTGRTAGEATKIVQVVVRPGEAGLAGQVEAVAGAYRNRFRQQAVGVVSSPVCAMF